MEEGGSRNPCRGCGYQTLKPTLTLHEGFCRNCYSRKDSIIRHHESLKKLVINNFRAVNAVLLSGTSLSLVLIAFRFYNIKEFKWNEIIIPLNSSWHVFLIMTFAHFYLGLQLFNSIRKLLNVPNVGLREEVYLDIISSENLFTRGITPKLKLLKRKLMIVVVDRNDLTYLFRIACFISLTLSMIDWDVEKPLTFITSIIISFLISYSNWVMGSLYLLEFYKLYNPKNDQL